MKVDTPRAPLVCVCITTHNRRVELERTLARLDRLAPPPDEIVVVADGCTDGSAGFVRSHFPRVQLLEHPRARGSVPSRNEMAAATACDVLLSLDDDSYPLEDDFIARVRELFASNPRLAVASFPQRTDEQPETLAQTDFGPARFIGSYANSAAALRRAVFQELGGYCDSFFHMYEEPDFALRCVSAGWEVRLEPIGIVRHHFTGTQRNELRVHQRHARNELWSVAMRCPAPQCFAVGAFRALRQLGYALKRGLPWVLREPAWWLAFLRGLPEALAQRRPLPWPRYLAWMRLLRTPTRSREEWEAAFRRP